MTVAKKHLQSGFTFIEIVVVLLILGLLAGLGVSMAFRWVAKAKENKTLTHLKLLKGSIDFYNMELGKYPTKLPDDLVKPPKGKPYIEDMNVFKDGWDNEIVYKPTPGKKHPYDLYSYGSGGPEDPDSERIDVWEIGKKN